MLRHLKLRTKLALLVVIALAAVVAVGTPGVSDRLARIRATEPSRLRIQTVETLGRTLRQIEREATVSAWWLASGAPEARSAIAVTRPRVDAAARAVDRQRAAFARSGADSAIAVQRVTDRWNAIRRWRVAVDRRVVGDAAALDRFHTVTSSVVDAMGVIAQNEDRALSAGLRAQRDVAELEATVGDEQAIIMSEVARAALDPALTDRLRERVAEQVRIRAAALTAARRAAPLAPADDTSTLRSATRATEQLRAAALADRVPFLAPRQWANASDRQIDGFRTIGHTIATATAKRAAEARTAAHDALVRWIELMIGVGFASLIVGLIVARAIRRPIRTVTAAALDLADREDLDRAPSEGSVARDEEIPHPAPISVRTHDYVGDLAGALHRIDQAAIEALDSRRRILRNDVGDLYVNLARRNQPLLNRQLRLIDALEANEHDPDRLVTLFALDHLATRMRRNAESLLVVAGMDDPRTHTEPLALVELVRAAVFEVEDLERVHIVGLPPELDVVGRVAIDFTHVLAELIENATSYSPPESRVSISARRRPAGLELTIADAGTGFSNDQLDALNEQLAHPPLPGLDLSRSLGLVVVARLCERIGITVVLRSAPGVGTAAVVDIPAALLRTRDQLALEGSDQWVGGLAADLPPREREFFTDAAPSEPDAFDIEFDGIKIESDLPERPPVRFTPVPTDRGHDLLPVSGPGHARHRRRRGARRSSENAPDTNAPNISAGIIEFPTVGPPLPRREPVGGRVMRDDGPAIAPPRAPDAVFELVARYEAGRRRAEHTPDETA